MDIEKKFQEQELLERIRKGDLTSFDILYQSIAPKLYAFIVYKIKDKSTAEDILQETFVRFIKDKKFIPQDATITTYLVIIAKNLCANTLRNSTRQKNSLAKNDTTYKTQDVDVTEYKELLNQALDTLSESQKESFILKHYMELSYEEIGVILSCPEGTIKSRVHSAILTMKEFFQKSTTKEDNNVVPIFSLSRKKVN